MTLFFLCWAYPFFNILEFANPKDNLLLIPLGKEFKTNLVCLFTPSCTSMEIMCVAFNGIIFMQWVLENGKYPKVIK